MNQFVVIPLFIATAVTEITGCYLIFLWMRGSRSSLLLVGATLSLAGFAWLLSLHPSAGRAYAAYGGVYVACALIWAWSIERQAPNRWDLLGSAFCLLGTGIISFAPRG